MTFNEGMRIDTSTTNTPGGPGRGPGRGIAVGGGVGGLLIVLLALFLGVDPGTVVPQQEQATDSSGDGVDISMCRTGADANAYVQCRVIATANSLDGVWPTLFPQYTKPEVTLFTGSVNTACGAADSSVGPFYCPADYTAYFDTDFFQVLVDEFGSSDKPLAQEYVVAHEFGHHVQNLQGLLGRAQQGAQGADGNGVRSELQADCYAGVWAYHAAAVRQPDTGVPYLEPLTQEDITAALSAAASVGDDRIQQSTTGQVNPEAWTHGSSEQRQYWFNTGYRTGDMNQCDTWSATNLG